MARIYKRNKIWYIDYRIDNQRIRKPIGKSKEVAELALKDIEVKLATNKTDLIKKDYPLDKFLDEFLAYSKIHNRPATYIRYRGIIKIFKKFLSTYPKIKNISHLKPPIIEKYKTYRKEICKSKTVNLELKMLKYAIGLAQRWSYIKDHPFEYVPTFKVMDSKKLCFFSKEELRRFFDVCKKDPMEKLHYLIFFTMVNTGMRLGEALNLQWSDIDLKNKLIAISSKGDWLPKISEDHIPINKALYETLRDIPSEDGYLFKTRNNKRIKPHNIRIRFQRICKKAGIKDDTYPHILRHTFASHLIMAGVDLATISRLLRHKSLKTTQIYAHLAPSHLKSAIEKFHLF